MHFTYKLKARRATLLGLSTAIALGPMAAGLNAEPVEAISIAGAEFVSQDAIKETCALEIGARYGAADLRAAESCLMQTGAFRTAKIERQGRTLAVEVEELNTRPGRLEFALGLDSAQGLYGSLLYERYNLLPGVFGGMELRATEDERRASSYVFSKDLVGRFDGGIDMEWLSQDGEDDSHRHRRFSVMPYLATDLAPGLRGEMGIGYRKDTITRIDSAASPILQAERGTWESPSLRLSLSYQSPESKTLSYGGDLSYNVWGIGQSPRVASLVASGESRVALGESYSLGIRVRGGIVRGLNGSDTRISDRFTLGSADLRGFAHRGISPRDQGTALGGERFFATSLELSRKVGDIFGAPANVGIFADAGAVWGLDRAPNVAPRKLRSSVGASLTLDVGGVPLSAYIAKPLSHEAGDKTQYLGLSVQFQR